ncbi:hypothetical protein EYF80_044586 [Liparis tanakae]|uniref:Uncharacterized protein n=1 Tax=Liparis tanakae TaxID=230148 RepID=A0A4Z2FVE7_9TELE|nr:hypothetical protein EYF80_044586 [Liparis tanakae]
MRPLWVLTSGFTGGVVSTGGTVVTTTGRLVVTGATVVAGRVGCTVCCALCGDQLRIPRTEVISGQNISQQQREEAAEERLHPYLHVESPRWSCCGLTASTYDGLSGQHVKPSAQSGASQSDVVTACPLLAYRERSRLQTVEESRLQGVSPAR